ncbi:hypothetical protein BSLG_003248 [Batrachochytrium salamandrivorans]|nr:hypothetical protein BSLG_003248 [Batrachochytrium salamandrivorans]
MSFIFRRLIARKPITSVDKDLEESEYKRPLTAFDLTMLGIGGIIGAGIFVLTGRAARVNAGPAVILSFIISGVVCALACLCYAELGSTLPISGSAYSFIYSALGELLAWIVGWDLMLEYLVGAATVAVGWGVYLDIFIAGLVGKQRVFDQRFSSAPFVWYEDGDVPGQGSGFYLNRVKCPDGSDCIAYFNIPAFVIVILLTMLLCYGVRETASLNNVLVAVKMVVCVIFILTGIKFIKPSNYSPFIPPEESRGHYGLGGVFQGSITVFFAYIGFDAVTTTAQEAANPQRDLPIGIIGSLAVCTVLYIAVSAVLTGMVHYSTIDRSAPVGQALIDVGLPAMAVVISFGIICGLTSVMLVLAIGQPRIFSTMALDGLLPSAIAKMHPTRGTPYVATIISGTICALFAALLPVDLLGNLTSVGTLSAFFLVSVSTLVLRITQPDLPRKFEIPGGFWFGGIIIPFLSAFFLCSFSQATVAAISRVFIWMAVGLVVYFSYGYHNSRVGKILSGKTPSYMSTGTTSAETKA